MFIPSLFKLACFIENIPLLCHVFVSSSIYCTSISIFGSRATSNNEHEQVAKKLIGRRSKPPRRSNEGCYNMLYVCMYVRSSGSFRCNMVT